jgi:hypothetical protein
MVFTMRRSVALREGALKIVRSDNKKPWELFDLSSDPGETKDLAAQKPADVKRLDAAFQNWMADVKRDASEEAPVIK